MKRSVSVMPSVSATRPKSSKNGTDKKIGRHRRSDRWFSPIALEFRRLFPKKTAENLASRAGRDERLGEIWLSGRGTPNGEALANLILSDVGDHVLAALTRSSQQPWAKAFRRTNEIAKARNELEAAAQRLAALEKGLVQ